MTFGTAASGTTSADDSDEMLYLLFLLLLIPIICVVAFFAMRGAAGFSRSGAAKAGARENMCAYDYPTTQNWNDAAYNEAVQYPQDAYQAVQYPQDAYQAMQYPQDALSYPATPEVSLAGTPAYL
jgi:hypothetical protein